MKNQKIVSSILLALAFAGPACATQEVPASIDEAHRAYYQGESERALLMYERLAAQGHAEAAERAGFMLLREAGDRPGKPYVARATALLVQAASAGRQGAVFVLGLLDSAD